MAGYFLGIDVGASKSHALISGESGRAVGFGFAGTGNPEAIGYDGLARVLHSITQQALTSAGIDRTQIAGAGFGIAGYDFACDRAPTLEAIRSLGLSAPLELVNDTIVGLLAGASAGWGIAVVAGSSCNCRGLDPHGREGRLTGGGIRFGEYGGAGELVFKAIEAVALEWTRRGPATSLTLIFMEMTGATSPEDLIEGIYRDRYRVGSSAAPRIFEAASKGDAVALELIRFSGRELGSLALGVIRQLGFESQEFEVVLAGSLYNGSPLIAQTLAETIHTVAPGARLVRLDAPPVIGGVILGMQQAGAPHPSARVRLIETTQALLSHTESAD